MRKVSIETSRDNGVIIIDNIKVEKEYRGLGLARRAMENFIKKTVKTIELHAYPQEEEVEQNRLVEFYESFGFEVVCGDDSCGYEMILDRG